MTINEKRQLNRYIKGLVRESIEEISADSMPFMDDIYGPQEPEDWEDEDEEFDSSDENWEDKEDEDEFWHEHDHPESRRSKYEGPDVEDEQDEPAGINELRRLTESFARDAMRGMLMEKKKKASKKKKTSKTSKNSGPRKTKTPKSRKTKEKTSSRDKTIMSMLNADATNAAHYYYKLYGVENGTEAEKAAARSKGYKKAKGKKNDSGVPYKFTSKERNRLNSLLTDRY